MRGSNTKMVKSQKKLLFSMRRYVMAFVKTMAVFVLCFVGFYLFVDNHYTHKVLKDRINDWLQEEMEAEVGFQKMNLELFPPKVEMFNLELRTSPASEKLITVNYVAGRVSLVALFLGKIQFAVLDVHHMSVQQKRLQQWLQTRLREDAQNPASQQSVGLSLRSLFLNQQDAFDGSGGSYVLSWQDVVQKVVIRHGTFQSDPYEVVGGYTVDASHFDLELDLETVFKGSGQVRLQGVRVQDEGFVYVEDGEVMSELSWQGAQPHIHSLTLNARRLFWQGSVMFSEALDVTSGPITMTVSGQGAGDLSVLAAVIEVGESYGRLEATTMGDVRWQTHGPEKVDWRIEGAASVENGVLDGFKFLQSAFDYRLDSESIVFDQVRVQDQDRLLAEGRGSMSFEEQGTFDFSIQPRSLSIEDIFHIIGVEGSSVNANLGPSEIHLSGAYDPFVLTLEGRGIFEDVHISVQRAPQPQGSEDALFPDCVLDYRWRFDHKAMYFDHSEGTCGATSKNVNADTISVQGKIPFTDEGVMDLHIALTPQDMAPYSLLAGAALAGGPSQASLRLQGPLDAMMIHVQGSSQESWIGGMLLGDVVVDMSVDVAQNRLLFHRIRSSLPSSLSPSSSSSSSLSSLSPSSPSLASPSQESVAEGPQQVILEQGFYDLNTEVLHMPLRGQHMSQSYFYQVLQRFIDPSPRFITTLDAWDIILELNMKTSAVSLVGEIVGQNLQVLSPSFEVSEVEKVRRGPEWLQGVRGMMVVRRYSGRFALRNGSLQVEKGQIDLTGQWPWIVEGRIGSIDQRLDQLWSEDSEVVLKVQSAVCGVGKFRDAVPDTVGLQNLALVGPSLRSLDFDGAMRVSAQIAGTVGRPQGQIQLEGSGFHLRGTPFPSLTARMDLDQGRGVYVVDFKDEDLRIDGVIDLPRQVYEVQAHIAQWDLAPYLQSSTVQTKRSTLVIDSLLQLQGGWGSHSSFSATWDVFGLEGRWASLEGPDGKPMRISLRAPMQWTVAQDKVSVRRPWVLKNAWLELHGDPVMSWQDSLWGVRVHGSYNLLGLEEYIEGVELLRGAGTFQGMVSVDSKRGWSYQMNFLSHRSQPVFVGIAGMMPAFRQVELDVGINEKGIEIRSLRGRKGGGFFEAQGFLPWRRSASATAVTGDEGIEMRANGVLIRRDSSYLGPVVAQLDATLRLHGDVYLPTLSGEIDILNARSVKPLSLFADNTEFSDGYRMIRTLEEGQSWQLTLDLVVKSAGTLLIQNDPLDLAGGGELEVKGSWEQPRLNGYVFARGQMFYKRMYEITEGTMYFNHTVDFDPLLEVTATTDINNYQVRVEMSGNLSDPSLELFSNPSTRNTGEPLSSYDILYLITNGVVPRKETSIQGDEDIFISQGFNLAFDVANREISKILQLSERSFIQGFSILSYTSSKTGQIQIRAVVPLNTYDDDLSVTLHGDPETVGVTAEYKLDSHLITSLNYQRILEEATASEQLNQTSNDTEARLNLQFRFAFP